MALDVLVLDLAEARGEQVARRREALDVLVEGHEVPLALLEDHAHLLGREQVQVLERVEVLRALCVDRRFVPRDPSGAAPRRRRLELRRHLDANAARRQRGKTFHPKWTLGADVAEELAAFRQRRGRRLRYLRERIGARAELPPRGMKRSTRGVENHWWSRPCPCVVTVVYTAYTGQIWAESVKYEGQRSGL